MTRTVRTGARLAAIAVAATSLTACSSPAAFVPGAAPGADLGPGTPTAIVYHEDADDVADQIVDVMHAWLNAGLDDARIADAGRQLATMPSGDPNSYSFESEEYATEAGKNLERFALVAASAAPVAADNQETYAPVFYGDDWANVVTPIPRTVIDDDQSVAEDGPDTSSGPIGAFNYVYLLAAIGAHETGAKMPPVEIERAGQATLRRGSTSVGTGPGVFEYTIPVVMSIWDSDQQAMSTSESVFTFSGNLDMPPDADFDEPAPVHEGDRLVASVPLGATAAEDGDTE